LLGVSSVVGDEISPPITSETLVGIWEAAPSWSGCAYRLEINRTGPSYLACVIGNENLVYCLTSSHVENGRVVLQFHCLTDRRVHQFPHGGPDLNDLEISGKGWADETNGTIDGSRKMRYRALDPVESQPISFTKPPWIRRAAQQANKCEGLINEAKARQR
jgi:hypothetical protein